MNPGRYYIPNYIPNYSVPIRRGIFQRLFSGFRKYNWTNLLNNANKTLNVVNQTIPLVRQVGPMVNNLKSMMKIAKAFGNETTNNLAKKSNAKPKEQNISNNQKKENSSIFFYN